MLKTPITYHGGKQTMLKSILPMLPQHRLYIEPFAGGAAVFFAKPAAKAEYLNDINGNVSNFYKQLKNNFAALLKLVEETLYCESEHQRAREIYRTGEENDLVRAWAFWVNSCFSYRGIMDNAFSFAVRKENDWTPARKLKNNKKLFAVAKKRLENTIIFNRDALGIINNFKDKKDAFFYLDPPYIGTRLGHYKGYQQSDFDELIKALEGIKGKFLLSTFANEAIQNKGFNIEKFNFKSGKKTKTELLVSNYKNRSLKLEFG